MQEGRAGQRGISHLQEGSSVLKKLDGTISKHVRVLKVWVTSLCLFQALTAFKFQEQQIKDGSPKALLPDKGLMNGQLKLS